MKILKKGNYFKAYATVDNENGTIAKVGDHLGSISIVTGKFVGATACLVELKAKLNNHLYELKYRF
jgi:hypothetical protein